MQYAFGELPCPLCLLQRVALFGVCFGIVQGFRSGRFGRNEGVSLLFAAVLLVVSARQTLLDIYPRPGHAYIGTAVFGIHMPVWSVLIAVALIFAFALKHALFGSRDSYDVPPTPALARSAQKLGAYVVLICAVNFISVVIQCGLGECHTSGYRMLGGAG
jgi:disulfide bond formation protein DsbB